LLTIFKGYEVKTEGDAFMVTFFNPLDAVRWCLACQQALLENVWPDDLLAQPSGKQEVKHGKMVFNGMRIRMGIHVGQPACRRNPITGRMDYCLFSV
jgi:class 3 adenylate cyclase